MVSLMACCAFTPSLSLQLNIENPLSEMYDSCIDRQALFGTPRNAAATLNCKS